MNNETAPNVMPGTDEARPGEPEECVHPDLADANTTNICEVTDPYAKADEIFTYVNAFIQGFRYMNSLPSLANCAENVHLSVNTYIMNALEWK